jgi:hypothetical protein
MMNWTPMWHHAGDSNDVAGIAEQMYELFLRGVAPSALASEVVA